MFAVNPGILAAGAQGGGKTYDEFVTHISGIATGVRTFDEQIGLASATRVQAAPAIPGGVMFGSPWLSVIRITSVLARVIQHALPSEAEFISQMQQERWIFLEAEAAGNAVTTALDRNGYLSVSGSLTTARRVVRVLAWIDGQPMRMQPHLGLGPEPYDW